MPSPGAGSNPLKIRAMRAKPRSLQVSGSQSSHSAKCVAKSEKSLQALPYVCNLCIIHQNLRQGKLLISFFAGLFSGWALGALRLFARTSANRLSNTPKAVYQRFGNMSMHFHDIFFSF
jgi:hypothetical protein